MNMDEDLVYAYGTSSKYADIIEEFPIYVKSKKLNLPNFLSPVSSTEKEPEISSTNPPQPKFNATESSQEDNYTATEKSLPQPATEKSPPQPEPSEEEDDDETTIAPVATEPITHKEVVETENNLVKEPSVLPKKTDIEQNPNLIDVKNRKVDKVMNAPSLPTVESEPKPETVKANFAVKEDKTAGPGKEFIIFVIFSWNCFNQSMMKTRKIS